MGGRQLENRARKRYQVSRDGQKDYLEFGPVQRGSKQARKLKVLPGIEAGTNAQELTHRGLALASYILRERWCSSTH